MRSIREEVQIERREGKGPGLADRNTKILRQRSEKSSSEIRKKTHRKSEVKETKMRSCFKKGVVN